MYEVKTTVWSKTYSDLGEAVRAFMALQKAAFEGRGLFPSLIDHETGKRWQ